jgi:hypothetical protein
MVAYSFQERFVAPIQAGTKRQTIRAIGKRRHAVKHDRIQLYTGMRTAKCRKIVEPDPICTGTFDIWIAVAPLYQPDNGVGNLPSPEALAGRYVIHTIKIGDHTLAQDELDAFAQTDGFESLQSMADFWASTHGPGIFRGVLITWSPTS